MRYSNIDALHDTSARCGPDRRHEPAQLEPVLLRHMPHGDGDEAGEPRFRRQRVVIRRVAPPFGDVVADREQMSLAIEEKVELGAVERTRRARRRCAPPSRAACARTSSGDRWNAAKIAPPLANHRCGRVEPPDGVGHLRIAGGQPVLRVVKAGGEHRRSSDDTDRSQSLHAVSADRGLVDDARGCGERLRGNRARCRDRGLRRPAWHRARRDRARRTGHPESGDRSSSSPSAIDGSAL